MKYAKTKHPIFGWDPYGTGCSYLPILAKCLKLFDGNVLEFGTGHHSSYLICTVVDPPNRVLSFEHNSAWFDALNSKEYSPLIWKKPNQEVHLIDDPTGHDCEAWDAAYEYIDKDKWSLAFIDHGNVPRRGIEMSKLKDKVDVIIGHDSQGTGYGFEQAYPNFKYKYESYMHECRTVVVSNKYDISKLDLTKEDITKLLETEP
tara:strand:- start:175 stop:783 length:609 start_codon:yes stop_codon:yes gene_type:complete